MSHQQDTSMPAPTILFAFNFRRDVVGQIYLNDLPVLRGTTHGPTGSSGGANHLLRPGTNTVSIELEHGRDETDAWFEFRLYTVIDADATPIEIELLYLWESDHLLFLRDPDLQRYPFWYRESFDLHDTLAELPYANADRVAVECSGIPALHEAIRAFHAAIERRDVNELMSMLSTKLNASAVAYQGQGRYTAAQRRADLEEFFAERHEVQPVAWDQVHYETRADGRVVIVRRLDSEPLLRADLEKNPRTGLQIPHLAFCHIDNQWHIVL